jgi:hypothetical protein
LHRWAVANDSRQRSRTLGNGPLHVRTEIVSLINV